MPHDSEDPVNSQSNDLLVDDSLDELSDLSDDEEQSTVLSFVLNESDDDIDVSLNANGTVDSVLLSGARWRAVVELKQQFDDMQRDIQHERDEVMRMRRENDIMKKKNTQVITQFETDRATDHANYQRAVKDYSIEAKRAHDAEQLVENLQHELEATRCEFQHIQREREIRMSEIECEREVSESLRTKVQVLEQEKQSRSQVNTVTDENGKVIVDRMHMTEADCWSSLSLVTMERDVLRKKVKRIESELAEATKQNEILARTNRDQLQRIEAIESQMTELNEAQCQSKRLPVDIVHADQSSALDQMEITLLKESIRMLNEELDYVKSQKPSKWRALLPLLSTCVLSSLAALVV